jgi:Gpi18-like mannosyltransferase
MNGHAEEGFVTGQRFGHIWRRSRKYLPLLVAAALLAFSVAVRLANRTVITTDLDFHILPWYAKLQDFGPLIGLGKDFYNYTPPYLYLLALATLTSEFMAPVTAVKLISTAFDLYCAYMVFRLVRLKYHDGYLPILAASAFFAAPTIMANSGIWGQADSTYTSFLLTSLYLLLVRRPLPAILFFGIALAFKPQAIFLAPFLLLMLLWRRIPWWSVAAVPVVYALLMWPAVVLGRTWTEVLTTYSDQAGSGKGFTHNAPNLYVFVPKVGFDRWMGAVVLVAIAVALAWVVLSWRRSRTTDRGELLLLALISAVLVPFFLPNMHDRYFYLADTLSIVLAFMMPEMWFIAPLFQLISGLSYSIYLYSASSNNLVLAAAINIITLVALLARQFAVAAHTPGPGAHTPAE